MKVGSKRRRTKAEMEEQREMEQLLEVDRRETEARAEE